MKKIRSFFERSYKIVAYFFVIGVLAIINYYHLFTSEKIPIAKTCIVTVIAMICFITINKFVISKIGKKLSIIIITLLTVIFLGLEVASVYYFRVEFNWDFKWIMDSAMDMATKNHTDNLYYFKIFPNNIGVVLIVTLAIKLAAGNYIGAYIANIAFVFLAVIFTILCSWKIGGRKVAINASIISILFAPLYLYTPIVYTDTLSAVFPVMTLFFWILTKESWEKSSCIKDDIKTDIMLFLAVIAATIGFIVKAVAAIVLVAICIDMIFCNRKSFKKVMAITITFIVLMVGFNKVTENYFLKENRKNNLEYPTTHWIMMGLSKPISDGGDSIGYGGYCQKDSDYTATSGNYQEKKEANIAKIKERLKDFGINGYVEFLYKKLRYVWSDGTYYSLSLIGWDTLNKTSGPYRYVLGKDSKNFKEYLELFNTAIFAVILLGFIIDVIRKNMNQNIRILGISVVGIAVFLLLWEARSRYIYFMIPIFIILAANGINSISDAINLGQKDEVKNNSDKKSKE
ncbi:MAG: hypothetical protein J6J36_00195 [Clostridia bacterium]|nr:hypothetical protein [Clostridia bacterium]